jgi:dimethylargininase
MEVHLPAVRFTRAIVRTPASTLSQGITTAGLGAPDYHRALEQHEAYVLALARCGLSVEVLPADPDFPDSTFVEDTALLTPACAILMRPGVESRRLETVGIEEALRKSFPDIYRVEPPGTADAGDIMAVGSHYFIGLSQRTNAEGARQVTEILESRGMTGSTVPVGRLLHLKSGVSYLEGGNILVGPELASCPQFARFNRIVVAAGEQYAANSVWVNGTVLVPAGYPMTEDAVRSRGYYTLPLDVSEFRKLDGGLSCLSLRF